LTPTLTIGQHGRNLALRNPLLAGPGTVGYGREHAKTLQVERLGAIVTNTTTLHGRPGNWQPRLAETPSGIILNTGVQNPGLRTVIRRHGLAWRRMHVPVILSLAAEDTEAFAACAELAEETDSGAALDLEPDLLIAGVDMVRVVDVVRGITSLPLIVRLPVAPAQSLADVIADLGAVGCDAVATGSPWPGLLIDTPSKKPWMRGGLMGPAIRPLALALVHDLLQLLDPEHITVIAAGGISSAADVAAFLAAGAAAVQLDTVIYIDPVAVNEMVQATAE
jgi:dihydroorotate dehydrogenase (NAD+) catalytic subunit